MRQRVPLGWEGQTERSEADSMAGRKALDGFALQQVKAKRGRFFLKDKASTGDQTVATGTTHSDSR
jgi:hypothetical protein